MRPMDHLWLAASPRVSAGVIAIAPDGVGILDAVVKAPDRWEVELPGPGREALAESGRKAILCFGDSLTQGLSRCGQPLTPYSSRLEEILVHQATGKTAPLILNAGVSNEKTKEMCIRLRRIVEEYDGLLGMVLIWGGTNDLEDTPACIIAENLTQLHRMAHAAGARTVVFTVPDCTSGLPDLRPLHGKELAEVNGKLRAFAGQASGSVLLADVAAAFPQDATHSELWEPDGVHFSVKGYEAIGDLLAKLLLADGWGGTTSPVPETTAA
eukprot:TRINITY_DN21238_c0_g1_i2.p1 TRINITY_DN21238_c0_g1~~TRINITY_DN21238_c0_g1_i2.p1  ORF type:complete len:269 (+),score=54.02 TRINITY_DN21238_c0_g1_i2:16-822(+)